MRLGPFVGYHNADFRGRLVNGGEIEAAYNLGEFLELPSEGFVLAIPGCHAPARFLRRAQVWHFMKLLRGGIGVAPEVHADASRCQSGVHLRAVVCSNTVGRK